MANNEPMTAARRASIKARCDAATPGPWVVSSEYASGVDLGYKPDHERTWGYGCSNDFVCDLNDGEYHEYNNKAEQLANASFIAHARQDIPDLLAEVERLRVENQRIKKSIDWLVSKRFPCPRDGSQCYKEIAIRNDTTYAENICEQHWRDAALRAAMKEEDGETMSDRSDAAMRERLEDEIASLEQELKFSDETEFALIKKLFDLKICHKEVICEQADAHKLNFEGESGCLFCWRQWAIRKARKAEIEDE